MPNTIESDLNENKTLKKIANNSNTLNNENLATSNSTKLTMNNKKTIKKEASNPATEFKLPNVKKDNDNNFDDDNCLWPVPLLTSKATRNIQIENEQVYSDNDEEEDAEEDDDDDDDFPKTLESLLLKQWNLGIELLNPSSVNGHSSSSNKAESFEIIKLLNLLSECKRENRDIERSLACLEKKKARLESLNNKLSMNNFELINDNEKSTHNHTETPTNSIAIDAQNLKSQSPVSFTNLPHTSSRPSSAFIQTAQHHPQPPPTQPQPQPSSTNTINHTPSKKSNQLTSSSSSMSLSQNNLVIASPISSPLSSSQNSSINTSTSYAYQANSLSSNLNRPQSQPQPQPQHHSNQTFQHHPHTHTHLHQNIQNHSNNNNNTSSFLNSYLQNLNHTLAASSSSSSQNNTSNNAPHTPTTATAPHNSQHFLSLLSKSLTNSMANNPAFSNTLLNMNNTTSTNNNVNNQNVQSTQSSSNPYSSSILQAFQNPLNYQQIAYYLAANQSASNVDASSPSNSILTNVNIIKSPNK
jgi:hypothetical protein